MNREFLQLAHVFIPEKHSVGGWYVSEKLDGMRALWDGGLTRGMPCKDVPFANVEKHDRYIEERISTGLWSRYGQPIYAPDWFLDSLSPSILDGELYAGRGRFQHVTATAKDLKPNDEAWKQIEFCVFDSPSVQELFGDGRINNVNFKKQFKGILSWVENHPKIKSVRTISGPLGFRSFYEYFMKIALGSRCALHCQYQLPLSQEKALEEIEMRLAAVTDKGGEGLMLRRTDSHWVPLRTNNLLKVKKFLDSEATVVGYITGRKTDKGSKLLGLMGAMIVDWNGKRFELSGFTDAERQLGNDMSGAENGAFDWAVKNPETKCPDWIESKMFPRGTKVTFRYRELTDDGIPKEARFWRRKVD